MLPKYSWWGGKNPPPKNLRTAKQLSQLALAPRRAVGVIYGSGGRSIYLYDPKNSQSVFPSAQFQAMQEGDLVLARQWAASLLERDDWIILDTETTGLKAPEICQIAIINHQGKPVLDTLVRPAKPIEAQATKVHSITNEMVHSAPNFSVVYPEILSAIACQEVLIYNAAFDIAAIENCAGNYRRQLMAKAFTDVMPWYAKFISEWNGYRGEYKYPKLQGNHSSLGDCLKVLAIIKEMAGNS